ncbi:MAG: helix-turn-helix domain-containing protein [Clostridia bacterium]|nr:helix-turn-helix domain-containing protein [Clostridia bacterium]
MIDRYTKLQKIKNGKIMVKEKTIVGYPTHWHEFYEIELIISGSGSYIIDGVEKKIEKNMLFFMTPVNFHKVITDGAEVITLMFMGEVCDKNMLFKLSSVFDTDSVRLDDEDARYLASIMHELNIASAENDDEYSFHLLNSIIGKICRLTNRHEHGHLTKVQTAMLFIQNNFRNEITLNDIADVAGVTPAYMSSIFLKDSGMNFKTYLNGIRYEYAKKLLSYSDMTVTDICFESGFNDYANFERNFRTNFGVSPREYRKASVE